MSGDRERKPSLADAAGPGQRDEAHLGAKEEIGSGGNPLRSSDERGERNRQSGPQIGHA